MAGGYILCEWNKVREEYPEFQQTFKNLEAQTIAKCGYVGPDGRVIGDWAPKTLGSDSDNYGRTTILPALFRGFNTVTLTDWRQNITAAGNQTLLYGAGSGHAIAEDFKIAWLGLAFPNKNQQISEVKWQIGDRKYGRIDIEEMKIYDTPTMIFEDGYIIDEETAFDLFGYVEAADYQRIVMLGAAYYKRIDKVLGNPGSAISTT